MKIRTSIAAAGAAAVLAGAGAVMLPAMASAHSTTHTLKFTAVQLSSTQFSQTMGGSAEKDVNGAGKTIGFDAINITANPTTHQPTAGRVALSTNGGFLYGTLKFGKAITGTVTGGTGTFKGATGTITAKPLSSTRTAVTITYTTP
jgi:hypothetical protein